jgi:hypothetical protein
MTAILSLVILFPNALPVQRKSPNHGYQATVEKELSPEHMIGLFVVALGGYIAKDARDSFLTGNPVSMSYSCIAASFICVSRPDLLTLNICGRGRHLWPDNASSPQAVVVTAGALSTSGVTHLRFWFPQALWEVQFHVISAREEQWVLKPVNRRATQLHRGQSQ